ncbi:MAG: metal ABC transporter substrate-binding protein [Gemmatimonadetes bacterium]|nr:metal ABC transporter substrate-binding protein [Gemmatimonadota bacterium]
MVVSIFPVADLVSRVGGDAIQVETLLPPRASPSTWEVTPAQIRSLSRAAGFVTVGGGLDSWLEGLAADMPRLRRLRLTDGLKLHREAGNSGEGKTGDPHVWLDPILVRDSLLPRISTFLQLLAPNEAPGIRERTAALADTLTRLDGELRAELSSLPRRGFVSTHDAWGYFAERYDLEPLGSIYESPGHEPSAKGLAHLVDVARASGATAVLAEPQLVETAATALAGELDAQVIVVDPLGGPGLPGRESYTELMRTDGRAFARALGAPGARGH